jgi:hypothetical protein
MKFEESKKPIAVKSKGDLENSYLNPSELSMMFPDPSEGFYDEGDEYKNAREMGVDMGKFVELQADDEIISNARQSILVY